MLRVAINGFGRIGRNVLRACYESGYQNQLKIVAVNDLGEPGINAHLLKYDTVHGRFASSVEVSDGVMTVQGDPIRMLSERDPAKLPWREMKVDLVLECTGFFTDRNGAAKHLEAGAERVLVSAPGKGMDATVVFGVNHDVLTPDHRIISNASCTTNCLAPLAHTLHRAVGIESGLMNTVHAYTNDQRLTDVYHEDVRRARSATHSMIPTKTGAAAAIGDVIPELNGKLDGLAVRVPLINVSLLDLTFISSRETSVKEINAALHAAANGALKGVLEINEAPLVSSDFNHTPASCIFDATQTKVTGKLVKVLAWYDNEWGFSNRMLDTALHIGEINSVVVSKTRAIA